MSTSTQSFEESLQGWLDGRLTTGCRLTHPEHLAIIMIGEKVDDSQRPAGLKDAFWKIVEGVQLDALPGVEQFAEYFNVSALELALYRQLWGSHNDEVLPGVIYRRVLVSRQNKVPEPIIKDFREEVNRWQSRLQQARAMIDRDIPDGLVMQAAGNEDEN